MIEQGESTILPRKVTFAVLLPAAWAPETIPITKDAVTASLQKWDDFIVLSLINVFYGNILYAYTKGYAA